MFNSGHIKSYQENQNLSARLVQSLILYLEDLLPGSGLHPHQVAQSRDAIYSLIEAATGSLVDDVEIQGPMLRIFSRISYDVSKNDISAIKKDVGALRKILTVV